MEVRDPNRPLLMLAALVSGIERAAGYEHGFGFVTRTVVDAGRTYGAALVVDHQGYDEWMNGWYPLERVASVGAPLLLSRLVDTSDPRPPRR